jgi:hypothetical protein
MLQPPLLYRTVFVATTIVAAEIRYWEWIIVD